MFKHSPVKFFSYVGVTRAVGVGEGVAFWRPRTADAGHIGFVQAECIANFVQAGRPRNVPVEQGEDVAESRELTDVGSRFPRKAVNKSFRNPLDDLTQRGVRCFRWPWECSLGSTTERVQMCLIMVMFFHAAVGYSRGHPKASIFNKKSSRKIIQNIGESGLTILLPPSHNECQQPWFMERFVITPRWRAIRFYSGYGMLVTF